MPLIGGCLLSFRRLLRVKRREVPELCIGRGSKSELRKATDTSLERSLVALAAAMAEGARVRRRSAGMPN